MPRTVLVTSFVLFFLILTISAWTQENLPNSPGSNNTVEGTVVSRSRNTIVVRTDDNQYVLFT